jgi:hypothetical protein
MNVIGNTSLMNMRFGSQGSGLKLQDQQNSGASQKKPASNNTNNTTKASAQNLQSTIVLEEDEKAIS